MKDHMIKKVAERQDAPSGNAHSFFQRNGYLKKGKPVIIIIIRGCARDSALLSQLENFSVLRTTKNALYLFGLINTPLANRQNESGILLRGRNENKYRDGAVRLVQKILKHIKEN